MARTLQDAVKAAGRSLGREWSDVQPFLKLLEENWYDTVESLRSIGISDLQALGIPQRFAKELLQTCEADAKVRALTPPREKGKGKGAKGKKERGEKGAGKSGLADSSSSSGVALATGGHTSTDNGKSKGKGKGKSKDTAKGSKGGKTKNKEHSAEADLHQYAQSQDGQSLESEREFQHVHKIQFEDDQLDEGFKLASRLIGKGGQNMKHIKNQTGASVWLCGRGSQQRYGKASDMDEPLHILVKSDDQEVLKEGVKLTNDLINTVMEEYSRYIGADDAFEGVEGSQEAEDSEVADSSNYGQVGHSEQEWPEKGGKGKKGKGKKGKGKKGKGKKGKHEWDGERPAKRARHYEDWRSTEF